jgi:hypothetical protein
MFRLLALIDIMSNLLLDIEDVLVQGLHTTPDGVSPAGMEWIAWGNEIGARDDGNDISSTTYQKPVCISVHHIIPIFQITNLKPLPDRY